MTKEEKLKNYLNIARKELKMYKTAYKELYCYFDSISDEEQDKVAKRLNKIFKIKTIPKQ